MRERSEIEALLSRAYRNEWAAGRLMPGLATVAAALNANDQCLARIAAVHLRLPDLPDRAARDDVETADVLIKSARVEESAPEQISGVQKASPDDPKHPGWPAGTPGGRGGQFRPKDDSELTQQVKSRIARRALRISLLTVLHVGLEAIGNLLPGVDVAADIAMVADIARTISEFTKLAIDAATAFDFAKKGPQTLEELLVSSGKYEEFSSYGDFYKDAFSIDFLDKRFGSAGPGNQYHHIVTQGGANADNIPPERLQNTDIIVILPTLLHEAVNGEYSSRKERTNMTVYQWLQTQPFDVQYDEGLRILRKLHILK